MGVVILDFIDRFCFLFLLLSIFVTYLKILVGIVTIVVYVVVRIVGVVFLHFIFLSYVKTISLNQ